MIQDPEPEQGKMEILLNMRQFKSAKSGSLGDVTAGLGQESLGKSETVGDSESLG